MAAPPFITSSDYPSVRRVIDPLLTAEGLPDAVIGDDLFLGRAAAAVLAADPLAASRTGAEEATIARVTKLLVAAYICRATRTVTRERFPDYEVAYAEDATRADDLEGEALAMLAGLTNTEDQFASLPGLRIGSGRRGW